MKSSTRGETNNGIGALSDAELDGSQGLQRLVSAAGQVEVSNGGYYVNVNNADAFLISIAYSKASIAFICLIGSLTALNTLMFSSQLSKAGLLCGFNDYLPLGRELRGIVMPVVYYCRFVELSVPTNILQLCFCLAALICALNRKSNLFLLCYLFLCMTIFFGAAFLTGLLVLNYEDFVRPAVGAMLNWVLRNDEQFCQVLEPQMNCRIDPSTVSMEGLPIASTTSNYPTNPSTAIGFYSAAADHILPFAKTPNTTSISPASDAIALLCGGRTHWHRGVYHPQIDSECVDQFSSFLIHRGWLAALVVEYVLVITVGLIVTLHALLKNRKTHDRMRRPVIGEVGREAKEEEGC